MSVSVFSFGDPDGRVTGTFIFVPVNKSREGGRRKDKDVRRKRHLLFAGKIQNGGVERNNLNYLAQTPFVKILIIQM